MCGAVTLPAQLSFAGASKKKILLNIHTPPGTYKFHTERLMVS
jgi:hypothetical protein